MRAETRSRAARARRTIKAVPVRHPGRWVAAAIVLVIVVAIVHSIATNPNFQWGLVGHYLFDSRILSGVLRDDRADGLPRRRSASCSGSCSR